MYLLLKVSGSRIPHNTYLVESTMRALAEWPAAAAARGWHLQLALNTRLANETIHPAD
jgi:hypothetical protein